MARRPTTRLQFSGYRFLLRRMEHALVRGDVEMLDDPLRAQSLSLIAGAVVAAIVIAGSAILAFLRPHGALGSAPIVLVRESGALYVRIDDTVHPVLNLASARLIAGTRADPQLVSEAALNDAKRGPLVGIPGAPSMIGEPMTDDESTWTVCEDAAGSTTAIVGRPLNDSADRLEAGSSVLVTPRSESAAITYLLYRGWRARVDLRDHAVVRALQLDGIAPRPVSRAVLDAIPEAPPIVAPSIPEAGAPGPPLLRGYTVGSVMRVNRANIVEHYVVLTGGVQRIGEVTADLIRFTDSQRGRDISTVAPDVIGAVPTVNSVQVSTFPEHGGADLKPVLCAHWQSDRVSARTNTTVLVGNSLPLDGSAPVQLAQADGEGPNVDSVLMQSGRSAYVRSVGVTGDGASAGSRYFVNDSGVVFGVYDEAAAERLGLGSAPAPAPWPVLARLPRGPELSIDGASITRDGVVSPS